MLLMSSKDGCVYLTLQVTNGWSNFDNLVQVQLVRVEASQMRKLMSHIGHFRALTIPGHTKSPTTVSRPCRVTYPWQKG